MKYYKLGFDDTQRDKCVFCDELSDKKMYDYHDFSKGEIKECKGKLIYYYNSDKGSVKTDYILAVNSWFIITEKAYRVLKDELNECAQVIPITICDRISKNEEKAYIVNILDVVENAIDFEKSSYGLLSDDDPKVYAIWKYVLKSSFIQCNKLFKLKEDMFVMFCSEQLKKLVNDNGLTGFSFKEIELSD
jgi:hypothetical protein